MAKTINEFLKESVDLDSYQKKREFVGNLISLFRDVSPELSAYQNALLSQVEVIVQSIISDESKEVLSGMIDILRDKLNKEM